MRSADYRPWTNTAFLVVILCLFLAFSMTDFSISAERTFGAYRGEKVLAHAEWVKGRAYLISPPDTSPMFLLACRVGPLWRACGRVGPMRTWTADRIHSSVTHVQNVLVFAGIVEDDRVEKIHSGGEDFLIADTQYFLFSWATDDRSKYLPAVALGGDGSSLYEVQIDDQGEPLWRPVQPGPERP